MINRYEEKELIKETKKGKWKENKRKAKLAQTFFLHYTSQPNVRKTSCIFYLYYLSVRVFVSFLIKTKSEYCALHLLL